MTVSYTSYKATATQAGITMLAGSATFQTLVGAASATLAKAKIVEEWGGTPALAGGQGKAIACDGSTLVATPPFGIVRNVDLVPSREGVGQISYRGTIAILILQARKLTSETPPESIRRATNIADAIRADIQAQFGTSGCFAEGIVLIHGPGLPDEVGADHDALESLLTIDFEG